MPFEIKVDKDFAGPTFCELEPVLDELPGPVEVRWTGSKQDILLYERNADRVIEIDKVAYPVTYVLVVPDVEAQEKTLWALGGVLTLPKEELDAAKLALFSRSNPAAWRKKAEALGTVRATLLITKVAGDAVRKGKSPKAGLSIAADCVVNHVSPVDADVLLHLRVGIRSL